MNKTATLLFVLALPFPAAATESLRAQGTTGFASSATVKFVIQVPRMLQMRLVDHPSSVLVTAEDIAAGEIVVRGPRVDIAANNRNGYFMRAELVGSAFKAMRLLGLPREVRADGEASVTPMPSTVGAPRSEPQSVEYRLQLAKDASPGRYAWPVALTIQDL